METLAYILLALLGSIGIPVLHAMIHFEEVSHLAKHAHEDPAVTVAPQALPLETEPDRASGAQIRLQLSNFLGAAAAIGVSVARDGFDDASVR